MSKGFASLISFSFTVLKDPTMCDYCSDLRPTVRIRVPKELSQMLLRASDRLADGTLIDITPATPKVYGLSLDFAKNHCQ